VAQARMLSARVEVGGVRVATGLVGSKSRSLEEGGYTARHYEIATVEVRLP
jgi:hypothetical protein